MHITRRKANITENDKFLSKLVVFWYGRQDLNLHGNPLEPKSNVSANSTTPAFIKLLTGGAPIAPHARMPCYSITEKMKSQRSSFSYLLAFSFAYATMGAKGAKIWCF